MWVWRFLLSPRKVLAAAAGVALLGLTVLVAVAYVSLPRIEVTTLEPGFIELCFVANVSVEGQTYIYETWACERSDLRSSNMCKTLASQLSSPEFLQKFRTAAIKRRERLSELFQGTDGGRLAFHCRQPRFVSKSHSITAPLSDFDGIVVCGVFSKAFSVSRPANPWVCWTQEHLPFIPSQKDLQKKADSLNRDAVDALDWELRRLRPELKWAVHPDWSWPMDRAEASL